MFVHHERVDKFNSNQWAPKPQNCLLPMGDLVPRSTPTHHPKLQLSRFTSFHKARHKFPIGYNGRPISTPKIATSRGASCTIRSSLDQSDSPPETGSKSAIFSQITGQTDRQIGKVYTENDSNNRRWLSSAFSTVEIKSIK